MAKKETIKDLSERINVLAYNINHFKVTVDNMALALSKYIDFKCDATEFKNHLENLQKNDKLTENAENDAKWERYNK